VTCCCWNSGVRLAAWLSIILVAVSRLSLRPLYRLDRVCDRFHAVQRYLIGGGGDFISLILSCLDGVVHAIVMHDEGKTFRPEVLTALQFGIFVSPYSIYIYIYKKN